MDSALMVQHKERRDSILIVPTQSEEDPVFYWFPHKMRKRQYSNGPYKVRRGNIIMVPT
jgi:hypothetical protein